MASKEKLQSDLIAYDRLREKLNACSSYLTSASNSVGNIKPTIDDNYNINDNSSNITNKSANLKNRIIETSNCIKNEVIPAISEAQNSIRREIQRIEEEERRRDEMAAARISRWYW